MVGGFFHARACVLFGLSLVVAATSWAAGGGLNACDISVSKNELSKLVKQHVPRGLNGASPAVGIYLSNKKGELVEALFEQNVTRTQAVASTQKTLTAYVAYHYGYRNGLKLKTKVPFYESYLRWDEQGNASRTDNNKVVTRAMTREGLSISFKRLLHNLLYFSANGSASAIADAVAGSQEAFVNLMNQVADSTLALGDRDASYFQNPHGLTDSSDAYRHAQTNKKQQSSVHNMAFMLAHMMSDKGFRNFLEEVGLGGAGDGHFDKKGVTNAAGTTVVRSIGMRKCSDFRVISVMFGRHFSSSERPNQADDFNAFHQKLAAVLQ